MWQLSPRDGATHRSLGLETALILPLCPNLGLADFLYVDPHFFFLLKKWFFSMWHINWREYVCRRTAPSIFTYFPFPFGHSISKKELQLALFGSCAHPLANQCIQRGKQLWLARMGHMSTLGTKDVSMPDITIRPSRNHMVWRRNSSPKKVGSFGWKEE